MKANQVQSFLGKDLDKDERYIDVADFEDVLKDIRYQVKTMIDELNSINIHNIEQIKETYISLTQLETELDI